MADLLLAPRDTAAARRKHGRHIQVLLRLLPAAAGTGTGNSAGIGPSPYVGLVTDDASLHPHSQLVVGVASLGDDFDGGAGPC